MVMKFKRNESFYIREGWFEKALAIIQENNGKNIFFKNEGITYLGIGSNMVKSLKYWLFAAGLISGKENQLTEFAKLILNYDPYFDDSFTWFLIHYNLVKNEEECPIFHEAFNDKNISHFTKSSLADYLFTVFSEKENNINKKYVDSDSGVFMNTYVNDQVIIDPENNYVSPLVRLKLIKKVKDGYSMAMPKYGKLSYLVIYYVLKDLYKDQADSFEIEESMEIENSPVKIFNLDKYMYLQYLEEMRRNGLITINKTAGLNTVYFENKNLDLNGIFEMKFEG